MINRVVLVGRLVRDPELRYTQSGAAVASFTVAVNRSFTNSQGERDADFIGCTIWRKAAENFVNYTHKGSLVGIDGRIQTSSYDNQQGERVYRTDVIVENFSLLTPRNETDIKPADNSQNKFNGTNGYSKQPTNTATKPVVNSQKNYNQKSNANSSNQQNTSPSDPFVDNSRPIDISDDDLPF
jgi:single stranded DNA-binding protein (ssb)